MPANYDNAAWFYDRLASLVFGNALNNAQKSLLNYVSDQAKILIVGGGTGKILEHLSTDHSSGLQITYVEISEKMTAIAYKRNVQNNKVDFIVAPAEQAQLTNNYDLIITAFLFDNFKGDTLNNLFNHLSNSLKPGGIWLNTDFQLTGKWWQAALLKTMLLFFGILCGVESKELPDMDAVFQNAGYQLFDNTNFYSDFIASKAYCKSKELVILSDSEES